MTERNHHCRQCGRHQKWGSSPYGLTCLECGRTRGHELAPLAPPAIRVVVLLAVAGVLLLLIHVALDTLRMRPDWR